MRICSVEGCGRKLYGRGWCNMHWQRWYHKGDPMAMRQAENGVGTINASGYRSFSIGGRQHLEHVMVAEKALGHALPPKAEVHHVNEDKLDNRPGNLVICPNRAYHMLLHQRARALDACGHADWLKCSYCGKYDDPRNLAPRKDVGSRTHSQCARDYAKRRSQEGYLESLRRRA